MSNQNIMPNVTEHYDGIAEQFATIADQNFFNAYWERPAMFSLMDNVKGKHLSPHWLQAPPNNILYHSL
ncbi:MAG: hypothetical protein AAF629_27240 [Chloroflexota bacterium]